MRKRHYDDYDYEEAYQKQMENAGKGGGGYVQNVNITSPKALSPYEVARQTRLQTRSMILAMQRG